ncbi:DUF7146 domain-containing protein [Pontibaca methylaminivorans]|uniref:Toprim domain-containing protein n=1 Tax=Pontibaca methylaminivorans TaxID=515897 RepID=A0A1R3W978_9RHOB|nr:toprim domain-containing protein [Pontibaca methylaminivorans]SIT73794.1 Toprim domain-containing protein [Pontibaca methylaminivorans]
MSKARKLTEALGGKWHTNYGTAPCPVCQAERRKDQTALTLRDGHNRLLANCKKSDCDFIEILEAAGVPLKRSGYNAAPRSVQEQVPQSELEKSIAAKKLWTKSIPITGTPVETYLRDSRKISAQLPDTLRFCSNAWHGPSRQHLPAMVARIDCSSRFAVIRTYLEPDGSGKMAFPGGQQKMMLGPSAGGHVLLRSGSGLLVVAEGIETGLSLASSLVERDATIWATLTAANMKAVRLPEPPGRLIIATDGDAAGRAAGHGLSSRAIGLGWVVEMKPAPDGMDWNDVLTLRERARQSAKRNPHHEL